MISVRKVDSSVYLSPTSSYHHPLASSGVSPSCFHADLSLSFFSPQVPVKNLRTSQKPVSINICIVGRLPLSKQMDDFLLIPRECGGFLGVVDNSACFPRVGFGGLFDYVSLLERCPVGVWEVLLFLILNLFNTPSLRELIFPFWTTLPL